MSNQEDPKEVPINTAPLNQFIKAVKSADSENSNEVRIKTKDAKRMAFAMSEILCRLNGNLEEILISKDQNSGENEFDIKVDGGSGW